MAAKFNKRFGIEVGIGEARQRFVNRTQNIIFAPLEQSISERDKDTKRIVVTALGDKIPRKPYWFLSDAVGDDFYRNLAALEYMYDSPTYDKRRLDDWIPRLISESEVDLGIRWENGQFRKSGAASLDDGLVNDPLRWLRSSGYETVQTPFSKGVSHFLHATKRPELLADVVTDMYESLEALAKIVTGRHDKDLSGNQQLFLSKVKASDEYKHLLRVYIYYANRFRHAAKDGQSKPELSPKEVESFIYLTGVFIRLAMPVPE